MQLKVFVNDQAVAVLENLDGFEHRLSYLPLVGPEQFVSWTMPVQEPNWSWPSPHLFFS